MKEIDAWRLSDADLEGMKHLPAEEVDRVAIEAAIKRKMRHEANSSPLTTVDKKYADEVAEIVADPLAAVAAFKLWKGERALPCDWTLDGGDEMEANIDVRVVNPMAYNAACPENSSGGMQPPWNLLNELSQHESMRGVHDKKGRPLLRKPVDVAIAVFVRIAAALQYLVEPKALQIFLDLGDLITLPRRAAAAGVAVFEFDRMHLSNVPDYVRLPLLCRDELLYLYFAESVITRGYMACAPALATHSLNTASRST